MEKILQTINITKKYNAQYALKDVSISLHKGEIYGLIGQNGAGKTTLLKVITQLVPPTDGKVFLFGSENRREWGKSLKRIGAVIEKPYAYDSLSAVQNLEYYCKSRGLSNSEEVIGETLKLVGLENTGRKKFKDFSLGMKQKLGIAIAISSRPDLLILDEPINGLDLVAITEFRKMILRLNSTGNMSIIISSHILSELYQIATRYGVLHQGRLIKEISKQEFDDMSEEHIILKTTQVSEASQVLKDKLSYRFKVVSENQINIFGKNHHISEVNKTLVINQVDVEEIYYFKQDLESYFMNIVKNAEKEN